MNIDCEQNRIVYDANVTYFPQKQGEKACIRNFKQRKGMTKNVTQYSLCDCAENYAEELKDNN